MVILPFYQILVGLLNTDTTDYAVFMKDHRSVHLNINLQHLSYNQNGKKICGICKKNERDLIGLTELHFSDINITPLFTLSDQQILYPALSPDNQKIAFIAKKTHSEEAVLRVIVREDFGWFPMPFVKLPASCSPICFCTADTLMYTNQNGALTAVLLSRHPKTVVMQEKGSFPVYRPESHLTAFVRGSDIVISGNISDEIKTAGVTALAFSNDGKYLLYAQSNILYRYSFQTKQKEILLQEKVPIVFIAEL